MRGMIAVKYDRNCHAWHYRTRVSNRDGHMTKTTSTLDSTTTIVEWAPFKLREGVSEAEFLRASDVFQREFVSRQPGFLRRELLRGKDGQWVDLVIWKDQTSADAVMAAAMEHPACLQYFTFMPPFDTADPGAGVLHFARQREYP